MCVSVCMHVCVHVSVCVCVCVCVCVPLRLDGLVARDSWGVGAGGGWEGVGWVRVGRDEHGEVVRVVMIRKDGYS